MTTHAWSENSRGTWKLEILFDQTENEDQSEITTGHFFEWILLVHGTKEAPYTEQIPLNENTKLAVAKNIHANDFKDKDKFVSVMLKQDHQKRLGDDIGM